MELQDSGNRREFDSGAVRDICEGKGRCDLLPLDIVADIMDDPFLHRPVCSFRQQNLSCKGNQVFFRSSIRDSQHSYVGSLQTLRGRLQQIW